MLKKIFYLFSTILICGCPAVNSVNGNDLKFLLVMNSLETSRAAISYSNINARRDGDSNKCIATSVASSALEAASVAIRDNLKEIPELDVDVSECLSPENKSTSESNETDQLIILVETATRSSLNTTKAYLNGSKNISGDPEVCKNISRAKAIIEYLEPLPVIIVSNLNSTNGKVKLSSQNIPKPEC